MKLILNVLTILLLSISCTENKSLQEKKTHQNNVQIISEVFQTERDEPANIDSPAIWHGPDGEHWLIATAKDADALYIADAASGEKIKIFGVSGNKKGQLKYPNGISVFDDYLYVVERDNRRVQVFSLPGLSSLGFISDSLLEKPYGIYIYQDSLKTNHLYVTDNYTADFNNLLSLNRRIHHYTFSIETERLQFKLESLLGDTTESGALYVVESIYGDPQNGVLLLAEEDTSRSAVKVYNLAGKYTGKSFGQDLFKRQVEGITLYTSENNKGYWIVTDQSDTANTFNIFNRIDFSFLGSFSGPKTTNTDGVWLTSKTFGPFKKGAFYAVHDDGNVSAFDWDEISDKLNLQ